MGADMNKQEINTWFTVSIFKFINITPIDEVLPWKLFCLVGNLSFEAELSKQRYRFHLYYITNRLLGMGILPSQ